MPHLALNAGAVLALEDATMHDEAKLKRSMVTMQRNRFSETISMLRLVCKIRALIVMIAAIAALLGVALAAKSASPLGVRRDTANALYAPADPRSAQNPAYSPDGQRVLFTVFHNGYNNGPAGLYILDRTSGEIRTLLDEPGQDSVNLPGTSWNGPRDLITFSSDREDRHEIWTLNPRSGALFRVTRHADGAEAIESSFSADGEWIVFEASKARDGLERFGALWKVRSDGTELTRLTGGPVAEWDDRQPNWSPRGDRIVFQRRPIGGDLWGLYTISPNGGVASPLLVSPFDHSDAAWSPDGRQVVFSSDHGGLPNPQIFVVSSTGGEPVRVTFDPSYSDSAPSWSANGRSIAFESHLTQVSPASLWEIAYPAGSPARRRSVRR